MKTLKDIDVKDKIVLVRTDYNVPLKDGRVESDLRIRASLPTIEYLKEQGAKKIILMSHLGRPKGWDDELSLRPVAERLKALLSSGRSGALAQVLLPQKIMPSTASSSPRVQFVDRIAGEEVKQTVEDLPEGGILLLENLRFDSREKENSSELAREIIESTGSEVFVQDGFAVTHRAHTSTDAVTKLLPSVAGKLVEKEVAGLSKVLTDPERPLVAIIGGAKVEDKSPLIEKFEQLADKILVGGKIAADGYKADSGKIYVAEDFDLDAEGMKLDIGPLSAGKILEELKGAKTVLWNGVLGKVEDPAFSTSTELVAKFLGEHSEITSVICGGDTAGFVEELMEKNPELDYSLVSTGGGAALVLLTGGEMPGLAALA
jgi:phosphoglycerate kinase